MFEAEQESFLWQIRAAEEVVGLYVGTTTVEELERNQHDAGIRERFRCHVSTQALYGSRKRPLLL